MARIVLAMSGGVDSSVAAHLLLDAGHDVVGVFMRHGEESASVYQNADACKVGDGKLPVLSGGMRADHKQGCCTASDAADARRVAARMDIPFYALDLQADFKRIVDYFVDDYLSGRTPNPCVRCNQWIKFGRLFDYADSVDAEFVATGHYARMIDGTLHRGLDSKKDQSYALFGIRRDRLSRMMLPVGGFEKPRIREIAESLDLGVAAKKDSQEICFVTQGHHSDFVRAREPDRSSTTPGNFVSTDGKVLGQHRGYEAFTIGQRKGLGIALGEPHFVIRIDPKTSDVVLGKKASLAKAGLTAGEANWLVDLSDLPSEVSVQIRYNSPPQPAKLTIDESNPEQFEVTFDEPQDAVAPGQAAVVYHDSRVLGGGWIQ
ncbi:tRNA 2-thiouridine(34) synthase MnmA [Rubripirellula obstinata]|nr:tRNA 2-thiouridine(34) synthase MnmA [Rubripirellula obstinata]